MPILRSHIEKSSGMRLCVIPARGGSKRIPQKNIKPFCGKPMIAWSIEAALNPTEGSFLYFVSKGDGTHFFSSTLEEHNRAVQKYQLNK